MAESSKAEKETQEERRQYVNFAFYKLDPAWRRLPEAERKRGKCQLIDAVNSYEQVVQTIPYSLVGIRGDCDFLLWRIGYDLLKFQEMTAALKFMGYDYKFEFGSEGHNAKHGGAILPDSLRWLWRDYPK